MSGRTDGGDASREPIDKDSLAWKFFNAFLENSDLQATEVELIEYVVTDLNVALDKASPACRENLAIMVVYFMNLWPGWQHKTESKDQKLPQENVFLRFKRYMAQKMSNAVRSAFDEALWTLPDERSKLDVATTAPKDKNILEFSPYCISVKCPPHMLNTLAVTDVGDDVIMKQHVGLPWKELNSTQLLNWPHIEVSFRTVDIHFVRSQATEYVRYLNLSSHKWKKTDDTIVEHVETIGGDGTKRDCYCLSYVKQYCKEYINALKTLKDIHSDKVAEVTAILRQFVEDVKHINVNKSIATNTNLLFRLSTTPYIRNKKLRTKGQNGASDADQAGVGYCEILIPKIELTVHYIKPRLLAMRTVAFEHTENMKKCNSDISKYIPEICYKCTFCNLEFTSEFSQRELISHLRKGHGMEPNVRCTVCKKQFDVLSLAACRWTHKCINSAQEIVTGTAITL